jgi:hypothetical protein
VPVWRGPNMRYTRDGAFPMPPPATTYSQDSLALLISFARAASDRHQAQVAHAYRRINAYEAANPGSFARWDAQRSARQAHVNAALAKVDAGFAGMILGPAAIAGAPAAIATSAGLGTVVLAFDAGVGATRGMLTGNYRTPLAEAGNRLTGTGANGFGVGDVVVGAANLANLARALFGGGSRVAAPATPQTSGNEVLVGVRANQLAGASREALVRAELSATYPGAAVQNEVYLRLPTGARALDPLTGTARRIDSVVVQGGRVVDSVEVTSMTANKAAQIAREMRIRQSGGVFVRDRSSGNLLEIGQVPTRIVRRP